jgi:hypothetical protein
MSQVRYKLKEKQELFLEFVLDNFYLLNKEPPVRYILKRGWYKNDHINSLNELRDKYIQDYSRHLKNE